MKTLFVLLLFIFSSLFCLANSGGDSTLTPAPKSVASMPFSGSTIPLVCVKLNGKDAWFTFDTGSEQTFINRGSEQFYGFYEFSRVDDPEGTGFGGNINIAHADRANIELLGVTVNQNIKVADLNALLSTMSAKAGKNIVGIIGSDVARKYHLVVDYSTNTIHL